MRLWFLCLAVLVLAVIMTLLRDETGRVGVIVFGTGLTVVFSATAAILGLFRTLSALVEARTPLRHAEALIASVAVVAIGSSGVLGAIFAGVYLVRWSLS